MSRQSRYPSDLTDDEWALVEPLLPPVGSGGRPEKHPRRDIVDAVLYVVRTGCSWRQLPAGILDSQSVKAADTVGRDTRGYDAGKKVPGRKRFIVTDPLGLLITVTVCATSVQNRDGAKGTLLGLYLTSPTCRYVFADAGFAGRLVGWASSTLRTTLSIVREPADQKGFAVLPRRWAVERTLAWLTAHRRLAHDYERHPATSEAMIRWAAIGLMTRRLARGGRPTVRQGRRPLAYQ
ncbi:transposase [Actinomadura bangladeshensis]|uniref:Transposase n=1 Tax=Actinomadura bangladeshensis TaxID=453573 RepID=A0A4R4P0F7_9ACTN|nr:transposase [Actinomadura bangladeshensis]TDC14093.1 transposase [Actinomadura bangladeshensis]